MCPNADTTRDAFGRMVREYHWDTVAERPQYRRFDGTTTEAHLAGYFDPPSEWHAFERALLEEVTGRVLDVGCGAGRTALVCQDRGHDVLAFDRSPGAVAVARERGVAHAVVGDLRAPPVAGPFDTVVAFGKQLSVGTSLAAIERTLTALARVVEPGGRLLADLDAPHRGAPGDGTAVVGGVAVRRFRVEYDGTVGPWTPLVLVAPERFREAVAPTPWRLDRVVGAGGERPDYAVVLERTGQSV